MLRPHTTRNETRYTNCQHPGCGVEVPYTYGPEHRTVPKYCVPHRSNKFAAERRKLRAAK